MDYLFCFPYAGGNSTFYMDLKRNSKSIKVVPLNYSGHASRFTEELYSSVEETITDMFEAVLGQITTTDNVYFMGYSMGAWVAYEVARQLKYRKNIEVKKLFLCAANAPGHFIEPIHELPEQEFLAKLNEFGGMPKEVLENKELLDLVLPCIKNDFKLCCEYQFDTSVDKTYSPICVIYSDSEEYAEEWKDYTYGDFESHHFSGNHFFMIDHYNEVCEIIKKL